MARATTDSLHIGGNIEEVEDIFDYVERARRTHIVMDFWGALLPARVVKEDLGDYIEDINRRALAGQRFGLYLRVAAAMFWLAVNTVGYWRKSLGKAKAG